MNNFIQTIACYDQANLVKKTCEFISSKKGNILEMEQHVEQTSGIFFLRVSWATLSELKPETLLKNYKDHMEVEMLSCECYSQADKSRMAVLVSKHDHCLFEILMRNQNNEWPVTIPIVISNHPELEQLCTNFKIPFAYIPITDNKHEQEQKVLSLLKQHKIDVIVLARYMQILTGNFVSLYPNAIINIHHSFLPAFVGAKPYHQAFNKGVKMVGATSHYVTEDLDQGPIIHQDITRVDHSHSINELVHIGKDVEKKVLSKAISAHLEHKIIVYNNKTIVFR